MSSHADTIPYLRAMLEADERHSFLAALDALLAENQRYEKALKRIADERSRYPAWDGAMNESDLRLIAREALAGDAE